ncbi:MAG: alcohol dehydrogenase catalytic domain-containing protein [Planctomycetota bacterium]|nr:alcohol dehydrogenase catalytic domain-containing protein [Planctomycetota bacterium]
MRAAKILDALKVETRDFPDPKPEGDDVVVRVEAAAICGSDLHALYQKPGEKKQIPGHEGAGVVVAVDKPRSLKIGDRVAVTACRSCQSCDMCRAGYTTYCRAMKGVYGFSLDGVHAEYVRIAESSLLPLPDFIPFDAGCLILDPVGTPYHALKRMAANATHLIGVFGLGPMGLGAVLIAARLGARVIGVDMIAYRRDLALKLGAWRTVNPGDGDVVQQIRDLTKGYGLDRSLECSGKAEPLHAALDLARPLGHVAIIGENEKATIRPSDHFNRKEICLSGSCCFPLGEYGEIVRLFENGLRATDMITHRFTVEQAAEAYRTFAGGNTGKVIFTRSGA